jgi:hypothetical protein
MFTNKYKPAIKTKVIFKKHMGFRVYDANVYLKAQVTKVFTTGRFITVSQRWIDEAKNLS